MANPEDQSVLLAGDRQFFVHRQPRKPNVDAIKKGNDEKQKDKGKNPYPHFLNRLRFYRDRGGKPLCMLASVRESEKISL